MKWAMHECVALNHEMSSIEWDCFPHWRLHVLWTPSLFGIWINWIRLVHHECTCKHHLSCFECALQKRMDWYVNAHGLDSSQGIRHQERQPLSTTETSLVSYTTLNRVHSRLSRHSSWCDQECTSKDSAVSCCTGRWIGYRRFIIQ